MLGLILRGLLSSVVLSLILRGLLGSVVLGLVLRSLLGDAIGQHLLDLAFCDQLRI